MLHGTGRHEGVRSEPCSFHAGAAAGNILFQRCFRNRGARACMQGVVRACARGHMVRIRQAVPALASHGDHICLPSLPHARTRTSVYCSAVAIVQLPSRRWLGSPTRRPSSSSGASPHMCAYYSPATDGTEVAGLSYRMVWDTWLGSATFPSYRDCEYSMLPPYGYLRATR